MAISKTAAFSAAWSLTFCATACGFAGNDLAAASAADSATISLAGPWRFRLDPQKVGREQQWYKQQLPDRIRLPGSTDEAKFGTVNRAKPTLDGLYRLVRYEGPAWYQRDIEIPPAWRGKRIHLFLERTHWETRLWLDDKDYGIQDSLIAPHTYDLGAGLTPGKHRLTICVDNTRKIDLGMFVSILYEGTQTNWNGLIGRLELRAAAPVAIDDVQTYPDANRQLVRVRVAIANASGRPARGSVTLACKDRQTGRSVVEKTLEVAAEKSQTVLNAALPMGDDVRLWDEFSPALYDLTVSLKTAQERAPADTRTITFGMRTFAARGTQFTINGRPLFLRGTLECAIFPRTGYPPTDIESWRRIYGIIKSYGLNHMRFHSWCPPEAAFAAADLEGVMLQVEGPQANVDAGLDCHRDAFLEQELLRIVRTYGNHPSFCLMTLGNEYGGKDALLSHWIEMLQHEDPRHLYSSPSSGQLTANRQYTETCAFGETCVRGVKGPSTDDDFRKTIAEQDRPVVGHEIGQWTFFPNFDEIKKYTGVLAAKNFEIVRADLAAKHLLDLAPQFVQATGKQAVLLYKEEIEVILRTPGYAGFSLLDLHDYPGQGTALIGPLDAFWDSKGFVAPATHRRYCGATVPLLRMKKRTFTVDESFTAQAEIAHFGPRDLPGAEPQWSIRDEHGQVVASGSLTAADLPTGKLTPLGAINASLQKAAAPCKLTVSVSLKDTDYANDWDVWVYPASTQASVSGGVKVVRRWDEAKALLAKNSRVVFFPKTTNSPYTLPGQFLPVFWSPIWFPKQQPNTMGILCDPKHPALAHFPTEFHSNWQWYDLIQASRTIILDDLPAQFRPIIQVVDNFARNHKLGNLFEAHVGKGRLLVCTIDLPRMADKQPAARQLLTSLYAYAGSGNFEPTEQLDEKALDRLFLSSLTVMPPGEHRSTVSAR